MSATPTVSRVWGWVSLSFLLVLASSPLAAGVIMKHDGSAVPCLFDPAQALTLSTAAGETSLTMGDIVWMAGGATKKARVRGSTELVSGALGDVQIACFKSPKDRERGKGKPIPASSVVFLFTDEVEVKKGRELRIEEFNGAMMVTVSTVPTKAFFVELLPENWSSPIQLTDPEYQSSMSNRSTLTIDFTIRGDAASMQALATKSESSSRRLGIKIHTADATLFSSRDASSLEEAAQSLVANAGSESQDPARQLEGTVTLDFGSPFYMEFGGEVVQSVQGAGDFLVYVEGSTSERLANDRLVIVNTLTNVNRLPITLSE